MPIEFKPWPKIPRWFREIVISEKIDGTNAAVAITEDGEFGAQSRSRLITPDDDNFGFAAWAYARKDQLIDALGPGTHFGEWWGHGIQRGYGQPRGVRTFSLFNTIRWGQNVHVSTVDGLSVVPQLYVGNAEWGAVDGALNDLRKWGSLAARFENPEGIVIYHTAARQMYKITLDGDAVPKTVAALKTLVEKRRHVLALVA